MLAKMIPPIRLHPLFILFIIIAFLTGTFIELGIIFTIVFIHEMGHYTMAKIFRWRIRKVMLWVFGGVMETEEHGSRPMKEELLVTIAGPFQHLLIYFGLIILLEFGMVNEALFHTAITYNSIILLFNLLPIWPLDGGKILFILLSAQLPYRKAYDLILILSMGLCIVFVIAHSLYYSFTLSFIAIMLFLFIENRLEWKRRFYVFLRFLLKRYEGTHPVRSLETLYLPGNLTLIEVFSKFKRDKKHSIVIRDKNDSTNRTDETDLLHAYFHEKQYGQTINNILQ